MSDHYYSEKPSVKSDKQTWSFTLRNRSYTFTSDSGVFSKKEVDFGSRVLIEAFEEPEIDGDFLDAGCGYGFDRSVTRRCIYRPDRAHD